MPGPRKPPSRRSEPEPPAEAPGGSERVQRILARAGFGSRRSVEDLIRDGRVEINGRVAVLGDRADPVKDRVSVDGAPVATHPDLRFYALNKPVGVTTTLRDPHADRSLAPFLPSGPRVFPVGRLDRESEGLLLLTNDGDLAHRLQHPRFGVEKEYLVEVEGSIPQRALSLLRAGVTLEDGPARPLRIERVDRAGTRSSLRVVMAEGRKRVVRRMMVAVGSPVKRLVRVRVGPVRLGDLPPGRVRPLLTDEVAALYRQTGLDRAKPRRPAWKTGEKPRVEGDLG
jgi:23S rRNA pseudouridine2605 synthase